MYSLSQVSRGVGRGVKNPAFFGRELNRLYHRRLYRRAFNPAGVDVAAADWDNLVILDACRYDLFEERHDLPGRLERRQSRGSHTVEFLEANFGGRELLDTVYVTASPQLYRWRDRLDAQFHAVVDVWEGDGWDDEYNTVLPSTMTASVERAADRFPDKRLIAHYVQPHYPFLESGRELNTGRLGDLEGNAADLWDQLMRRELDVPVETLWRAYRENLDAALPHVDDLLSTLTGRTVVTADHGNMIGERAHPVPVREWGHPPGIYTDQLVAVPWLVHEADGRRDISADPPERSADVTDDTVSDRLRHLGYAE